MGGRRREYDRIVSMRITLGEYHALRDFAASQDETMANVLRHAMRAHIQPADRQLEIPACTEGPCLESE